MIDELRSRASLGAERLPGWVRRIGVQPFETAVFYRRHGAAAGDAQSAIAVDVLRSGLMSHDVENSLGDISRRSESLAIKHIGSAVSGSVRVGLQ